MTTLGKVRVCEACIASIQPQSGNPADVLCSRCGDALGMESARFAAALGASECTLCRLAPPAFTRAVAFAAYDAELREILRLLKFNARRSLAEHILGQGLATVIQQLRAEAADDLLVIPVPLFAARERARSFNQSTLLAEAAIRRLRLTEPAWRLTLNTNALTRTRDTRSLFTLAPHQRRAALSNAFRITDKPALQGREILLIDDIMTTGATARECSQVLLRAGAAKVWVATVAKAQPETLKLQHSPGDVALWTAPTPQRTSTEPLEPDIHKRITF